MPLPLALPHTQSNYMYEWDWLLGECPRLLECPAVLACYGDSSTGNITNVRGCFVGLIWGVDRPTP